MDYLYFLISFCRWIEQRGISTLWQASIFPGQVFGVMYYCLNTVWRQVFSSNFLLCIWKTRKYQMTLRLFMLHVAEEATGISRLSLTDVCSDRAELIKGLPRCSLPSLFLSQGMGGGGGALLHLVHLKGFSPASPHTHILYLCDVHASETQAEHTSARRPVGTLVNVRGPGDLSHHTSVLAVRARRCMEGFGRWKTDTMHFPVTLLERPASLERRALCLRLIPSLAANYFMLSFELSVEIQLSDCLCSLHNWGGDKGMGEEGRTEMAERDRKSRGKHAFWLWDTEGKPASCLFAVNVFPEHIFNTNKNIISNE